jgi:hypothetical protein
MRNTKSKKNKRKYFRSSQFGSGQVISRHSKKKNNYGTNNYSRRNKRSNNPRNATKNINIEEYNVGMLDRLFAEYGNIFSKFKENHNLIKSKIAKGEITYEVKHEELSERWMPSKLDVLKVLKDHPGEKLNPRILNDVLLSIDLNNNANIDEIDNKMNEIMPTFFKNFFIVKSAVGWISEKNYDEYFGEKKYDTNNFQTEMTEFVSVQMSEEMVKQRNLYEITYTDKSLGVNNTSSIKLFIENIISDSEINDLVMKLIPNILIYSYMFPQVREKPLAKLKAYLCKNLKMLPPKGKGQDNTTLFIANNINSGVTGSNGEICIFREEELPKVLLHECFHAYNLVSCNDTVDAQYAIYSSKHLYNETVIETLADIFNTITLSDTLKDLKDNLAKEINFCFKQAGKILNYSGYTIWYEDDSTPDKLSYLLKTPIPPKGQPKKEESSDEYKNKIKITEYTNVHAYFILRTILMWDLPAFFGKIVKKEEKDVITIIDGTICNTIIDEILKQNRFNDNYIKLMNLAISSRITDNSLRMTILE